MAYFSNHFVSLSVFTGEGHKVRPFRIYASALTPPMIKKADKEGGLEAESSSSLPIRKSRVILLVAEKSGTKQPELRLAR